MDKEGKKYGKKEVAKKRKKALVKKRKGENGKKEGRQQTIPRNQSNQSL